MNRFVIVELDEDNKPSIICCDQQRVSKRIDMADCYDNSPYKIYYVCDGGFITEVRVGPMWKESIDENSFIFGHADLLIHGDHSVVGQVNYTDH